MTPSTDRPDDTANSTLIELDQIELPPEASATPAAETPAPVADSQPERSRPTAPETDPPPEPAPTPPLPDAIRIVFIVIAGITAAVWAVVGILYFMAWILK